MLKSFQKHSTRVRFSFIFTTLTLLALLHGVVAYAGAVDHVIVISVDGMGSEYVKPLLANGLANELTTFKRFQTEGAGTLNARNDADFAITLPNHVTMMASRGVNGTAGHNWTSNSDPAPTDTLASKKGYYIASGFDVAHDNGLRTGIWSGKSKFSLFQQSYNATSGASDATGPDNGRDKIDYDKVVASISAAALTTDFTNRMVANPFNFVFLHYQDPDATGHSSGWSTSPASAFATTLKTVDTQIGKIMQMVENSPTLQGKTAIILTADHGGHGTTHGDTTNPLDYTIPFYVWGPGVMAGGNLYTMNPTSRTAPGASVNPPYTGGQPVRNGEAANAGLKLLGLPPVPGSTIGQAQDLALTVAPPTDFCLRSVASPVVLTFSTVSNVLYDVQARDDLYSGSWVNIATNIAGTGGRVTNIETATSTLAHRFYRLRLHF
jgi:hypothetical protein